MTLLCKLLNGKYFISLGANVIDHVGYSVMDSPFERVEIAISDHDDISQMQIVLKFEVDQTFYNERLTPSLSVS